VQLVVRDDDEIPNRVEGVLEKPALAQDFVQQLDVLDGRRYLPAEFACERRQLSRLEIRGASRAAGRGGSGWGRPP
jgi:hypothetical protein